MNKFLETCTRLISIQGSNVKYKTITRTVDEIEGTVTEVPVVYSLTAYPKHIQATTYNYPALVGRELIRFYLANNSLSFTPKTTDSIEYKGNNYIIDSIQEHVANGQIVLYRILTVKG